MANLKEIRKRIVSVQNTQKITRAMTMISASKLHRARLDIENSRYYNQTLKEMVLSLQQKAAEYLEAFLEKKTEENSTQKVAILLYTSDRGLCGALNSGLCKKLERFVSENKLVPDLFIIGKKGKDFFQTKGFSIQSGHYRLKENTLKQEVPKSAQSLIQSFLKGEYKEIYLAFNYFKSAITEKENKDENTEIAKSANRRFLLTLSEHAARMRVMDSAKSSITEQDKQALQQSLQKLFLEQNLSTKKIQNKKTMNKGNITQVIGPVVDIEFEVGKLPKIYDAVTIDYELDSKKIKLVTEVQSWRKHCTNSSYECNRWIS